MSKRSSKLLIQDILESGQKILNYTDGISFDEFSNDSKTIDAVIRNFEVIEKRQIDFLINLKTNTLI